MGEGTCRRGANLHAYPEGGHAASGWHKGGRSYGVSTTPLPKSALALPSNLPTYCIRARLQIEPSVLSTLQPLFLSLSLSLSLSLAAEQILLGGSQPVPWSYFELLKATPPSYAQRSFVRRRERKRSLQGYRNKMALLDSVARVERDSLEHVVKSSRNRRIWCAFRANAVTSFRQVFSR